MGCVFVVMPREEDANRIAAAVESAQIAEKVFVCRSGTEVLEKASDWDTGVVVSTRKLRDMSYTEMCEYLSEFFGMVIITGDADFDPISQRVVGLRMPFRRLELTETVEHLLHRLTSRKKKTLGPRKRSNEEQQIVDQAKAILMETRGMTEPEAFRYIQKNSMDSGRSMIESAEMILYMKS